MDSFAGEIRIFGFDFPPVDWARCDGATMMIAQFQLLYAVIGTVYGGNGTASFKLPNLQAAAPVGPGTGPSSLNIFLGKRYGNESLALASSQLPSHSHTVSAAVGTVEQLSNSPGGNMLSRLLGAGGAVNRPYSAKGAPADTTLAPETVGSASPTAHENRQPYLAMNFCISLNGAYPPRPNQE